MPDKSVAAEELGVSLGLVGSDVTLGISELATAGLSGLPLLAVLRHNLAKLSGVSEDSSELGIAVESTLTKGSAEVLKTGTDGELVKLGRDGGGRKKRGKESLGVHGGDEERASMWRLTARDWPEELQKL